MGGRGSKGRARTPRDTPADPLLPQETTARPESDVSGPSPEPAEQPDAASTPAADAPLEVWSNHVGQIYDQLTDQLSGRRDWVPLRELRALLGDAPRDVQDRVLRAMSRSGEFTIAPDSNRKALDSAERDAAIRIGGEDNHLIIRARP